jgi:hypothetical protein
MQVTINGGTREVDVRWVQFHDYCALRMNEAPAIEVHLVRSSDAPGGIGEPGTAVTAPAVANASMRRRGNGSASCPFIRRSRALRGRRSRCRLDA